MERIKILIVGIGGVGGYFGGLLAKEYESSKEVDVYFLSRGENLKQIKKAGLKIIEDDREIIAKPTIVSNDAKDFGIVNYILFCTKSYDIDKTVTQLLPCINEETVLVPLQNGVNNRTIISKKLKSNLITEGCVYLISRLEKPGVIVKKGNVGSLFFGLETVKNARLDKLQVLLSQAKVKSELSNNIRKIAWEKFIFLSAIATATTYFDAKITEVLKDELKVKLLGSLIDEVTHLAESEQINIGGNQSKRVFEILNSLPAGATTSMHSDFTNKKKNTELESLTGYVVNEGKRNKVVIETFEKMYNEIKKMK